MATVLIATDGSDAAIAAARSGLQLLPTDVRVVVATVVETPDPTLVYGVSGMAGPEMTPGEWQQMHDALHGAGDADIAVTIGALGLDAESRIGEGAPGPTLCDIAAEVAADIVVIGSSGRSGLGRAMLGSVSDHVLRNAPCPVLVSRGEQSAADGPILVGTDGSEAAVHAAAVGVALLAPAAVVAATISPMFRQPVPYDGSLEEHIIATDDELAQIHAARESEATVALDATIDAIGRVDVERRVAEGKPADTLCEIATELGARVIVIGSRGRNVVARAFLGSVSDHIVRNAPCPVLVDRLP